ncbi:putative LPS assembly protein LptD [Algoriphagus lacus]|uniref:putative LPS assembly protein LptD n=1 Tax=Algoriphagus lacus TaxID=2056311 RepID=UPI001F2FF84F|nr:putative LPS assembly protein LptD [Algoriphagus lacus]
MRAIELTLHEFSTKLNKAQAAVSGFRILFLIISGLLIFPQLASAQRPAKPQRERVLIAPDTLVPPARTLPLSDTLAIRQDTLINLDSAKMMPTSDIQTDILYFAEDSIITDFTENKVYLYKKAWFEYGEMKLEADRIVIDWKNSELYATGVTDSLGAVAGNPFFKDGETVYEIRKEMKYNFKTQKAIIKDVVTEQQDGVLRGETIKKTEDGSIYLDHGYYTTCKLTEPHWHISSTKIKSIQGKQVVSGPFNLYFNGIPTPLGLPFGLIPDTPEEKASGVVFPSYGKEQTRGIFLRDFGYYFAINDYIHARITGDIYSKGGWGLKSQAVYNKRYRYSGGFNVDFQKFVSPETELNPVNYNTFRVQWNHTPVSRGTSRFSASVNAGSTSYFNNVVSQNNFANNITADLNSNISYSKTFSGTPFSMSANFRHSQSVQTGEVRLDLPTVAMNMNRQSPFKNVKFEPLKTLNIAWNFNMQNTVSNRVQQQLGVNNPEIGSGPTTIPFNVENLDLLFKNANNGARNTIPLSSNFTLFNYFTGTASINYTELWYLQRQNYYYNPAQERVDRIVEDGFNRVSFYNTSFSMNTNFYGFYNFKPKSKIQTIRHHIAPTFGFNYTPDFSDPSFGYYQRVQEDASGRTQLYSRHQGFIFGGAPLGESRALSIGIRNVLEAKVLNAKDSTSEDATKKIPLLESFNINTAYNFAADSFQLSPFQLSARTSFFDRKLSVNLTSNIDPYAVQTTLLENGKNSYQRINEFAWSNGQGIGMIRNASLNMNASINPRSGQTPGEVRDEITQDFIQRGGVMNEFAQNEINRIVSDPSQYIDWEIPWNLTIGYNLAYSRQINNSKNITQTMNLNGDLSLSEKWKINFNTGFDFQAAEITQTMIGIARDLHCWQMNVNWVPFGKFTSYNIDIRVKSSILQDLKVSRRRSFFDF